MDHLSAAHDAEITRSRAAAGEHTAALAHVAARADLAAGGNDRVEGDARQLARLLRDLEQRVASQEQANELQRAQLQTTLVDERRATDTAVADAMRRVKLQLERQAVEAAQQLQNEQCRAAATLEAALARAAAEQLQAREAATTHAEVLCIIIKTSGRGQKGVLTTLISTAAAQMLRQGLVEQGAEQQQTDQEVRVLRDEVAVRNFIGRSPVSHPPSPM